jgi:glycosyltransferase involved in cell wall biosynthesis
MFFSVKKVDAELAEKMALVLKDEKGREAMVKRGRDYAGRLLWDRIAAQFEDALEFHLKIN